MPVTRVLIYDDNADRRESLSILLGIDPGLQVVGAFPDCTLVAEQVASLKPDVVLMDIDMPEVDGIAGLKIIKAGFPGVKVLMQTVFEQNEKIFESVRNGASGYILKTEAAQRIPEAIRIVQEGGAIMTPSVAEKLLHYFRNDPLPAPKKDFGLSDREAEVLRLLSEGNSYKMIAARMAVTYFTVNAHLKKVYEKLQVHSSGEAIALARRSNLL